jgi:cytochrome P450
MAPHVTVDDRRDKYMIYIVLVLLLIIFPLLCSRAYHRSLRNTWQPAFFSESLEGYADLMNAGAERLLRRLGRAAAKQQEINVWRFLGDLTMDVVGTASFGYVTLWIL